MEIEMICKQQFCLLNLVCLIFFILQQQTMDLELQPQQHVTSFNSQSNQSLYFPQNQRMHAQNSQKNLHIINIGHWSPRENSKYYAFLKKFESKFAQKQSRRQCKVFKALSKFIKTRNANQCRSHHHKMTKNFPTISQTLEFLSNRQPSLEINYPKYSQRLDDLEIFLFTDNNTVHINFNHSKTVFSSAPASHTRINQLNLDNKPEIQQKVNFKTQNVITSASYQDSQVLKSLRTSSNLMTQPFLYQGYQGLSQYSVPNLQKRYNIQEYGSINSYRQQQYQKRVGQCHTAFLKWICKVKEVIEWSDEALSYPK